MSAETEGQAEQFEVLFVCTGNIHRSPMAASLFAARVKPEAPISVASAGVQGVTGASMGDHSLTAIAELGADGSAHRARVLTPDMIVSADLILAAEQAHRQRVLREVPLAMRRTFTLVEFARLAAGVPEWDQPQSPNVGDLRERVAAVAAQRGISTPPLGMEDIADPVHRDLRYTRAVAQEIARCVDAVAQLLAVHRELT